MWRARRRAKRSAKSEAEALGEIDPDAQRSVHESVDAFSRVAAAASVRIEKTGRGRFCLRLTRPLNLVQVR